MRPDSRSVSFTFHREVLADRPSPQVSRNHRRNLRQRLQDKFDKEKTELKDKSSGSGKSEGGKVWSNLSLGNVSADSRKAFRSGAEKLSKTISSVRTTIGTISQKFRSSTRRRQILDEQQSPMNYGHSSETPQTRSRCLLGRTPTKLYSPFGIESPRHAWGKENDTIPKLTTKSTGQREPLRPFRFIKAKGFSALR